MIQKAGNDGAQLAAMIADFLPETLAVGASFAIGDGRGRILAILIAAQNLPEAFNAFREMTRRASRSAGRVLAGFFALSTLGPLAGIIAHVWLAGLPIVIGGVMLFVAGGILYLTFQDIAPGVRLKKHWAPPFGAVGGFVIALAAQWLAGG